MEWLKELFEPHIPYLIPLGIFGMFLITLIYTLLRAYILYVVDKEDEKTKELLNSIVQNTKNEE